MTSRIFGLLCAGLLLLASSISSAQGKDQPFTLDTAIGLNAYQGLVEEHLAGVLTGLKALAATEEAVSGSWERLKGPLEAFSKDMPAKAAIWFARPDGSYFAVEKGLTGDTLKDRAYFPALMKGKAVAGSLVVSKSTGERSIVVAAPIVKNGQTIGVLGVSVPATLLAKRVSDVIGRPNNVIFYTLDASGQTALHSEPSLIFAFPSDMGDKTLKSAVEKMLSEPEGVVNYTFRDVRRTAIFRRSKTTGWVFVLGIVHAR